MANLLDWNDLLCPRRIRELMGGKPSGTAEDDPREEFERDYDRAVFSTAVRRLQDKTQVFPLESLDAVRTRLTHSLEVSTIARRLARQVGGWICSKRRELPIDDRYKIETIAATCGLIHDLGNPPFGHVGEDGIREWFAKPERSKDARDLIRFDGNAQTLRLVSRLQVHADMYGLNLTAGTLSALCKYTASGSQVGTGSRHEWSKLGYFQSEADIVDVIRKSTGTNEARNPITYLVEAADDIAYAIVDVEDALKKGVLSWFLIKKELSKVLGTNIEMVEAFAQDVERNAGYRIDLDQVRMQKLRTDVIAGLVYAAKEEFKRQYDAIMNGSYHGELLRDCVRADWVLACKSLAAEHVYTAGETVRLGLMGCHVIHELMDLFWKGAAGYEGEPPKDTPEGRIQSVMSMNYRQVCEFAATNTSLSSTYRKLQLVSDYVCGMTDSFACRRHRELTNSAYTYV